MVPPSQPKRRFRKSSSKVVVTIAAFLVGCVWLFTTTNKNQESPDHNGLGCLDASITTICMAQKPTRKTRYCREDPRGFFTSETKSSSFTREETEARNLFSKLDALSIGAARSGLCNDVVKKNQTLCTDRPQLDLFDVVSWLKLFSLRTKGARVLHAEHVLEHFHPLQVQKIAAAAFMMMEPGGVFRIAVPDGYKPSPSYQQYIRAGGTASGGGQKHMVAWTIDSLTPIFSNVGFEVIPREYFDAKGKFHTFDEGYQDKSLGTIGRSYKHDRRNRMAEDEVFQNSIGDLKPDLLPGEPRYTSLWFDAVKPRSCKATMVGTLMR